MPREWLRLSSPVPYVDCSDPALEAREQETNKKNPGKQQEQKSKQEGQACFYVICVLMDCENFYLTRIIRKS